MGFSEILDFEEEAIFGGGEGLEKGMGEKFRNGEGLIVERGSGARFCKRVLDGGWIGEVMV